MTTHTPGPWEAINFAGAGWSVRKAHERPGYTGRAPICSMAWFQFPIPGIIDDDISEANARLIASAPDLLAACEAAMDCCGPSDVWNGETQAFLRLIEDAVKKARA